MKISNKKICDWYIKTFHTSYFYRMGLNWNPFSYDGKRKIAVIKAKEPYRIFDVMMCWASQSEGYKYWLCESLKLTSLCFIINKTADANDYLQDLVDRARNYLYDKEVEKVITQIQKEIYWL